MLLRDQVDCAEYAGWCALDDAHLNGLRLLVEGGFRMRSELLLAEEAVRALVLHTRACVLGSYPRALPLSVGWLFEGEPPRPPLSYSTDDPDLPRSVAAAMEKADRLRRLRVTELVRSGLPGVFSDGTAAVAVFGTNAKGPMVGVMTSFAQDHQLATDLLVAAIGGASVYASDHSVDVVLEALDEHVREARGVGAALPLPLVVDVVLERCRGVRSEIPDVIAAIRNEISPGVRRFHEMLTLLRPGGLHLPEAKAAARWIRGEASQILTGSAPLQLVARGISQQLLGWLTGGVPGGAILEEVVSHAANSALGQWSWLQRSMRPSLASGFRRSFRRTTVFSSDLLRRDMLMPSETLAESEEDASLRS